MVEPDRPPEGLSIGDGPRVKRGVAVVDQTPFFAQPLLKRSDVRAIDLVHRRPPDWSIGYGDHERRSFKENGLLEKQPKLELVRCVNRLTDFREPASTSVNDP